MIYTYLKPGISRKPWSKMRQELIDRIDSTVDRKSYYRRNDPLGERDGGTSTPEWCGPWDEADAVYPPMEQEVWLPYRLGNLIYAAWGPGGIAWANTRIKEISGCASK
jgi:hypothetical protein